MMAPIIINKIMPQIDDPNVYTSTKDEICSLVSDFYICEPYLNYKVKMEFIKTFISKFEKFIDLKSNFIVLEKTIFTFEHLLCSIKKDIEDNKKLLIYPKMAESVKSVIRVCEEKILPLGDKLDKKTIAKFTKDKKADVFSCIKTVLNSVYEMNAELKPKESINEIKNISKQEDDKDNKGKCILF